MRNHDVIVVAVTYGERKHPLLQVLDVVSSINVSKVVVVDNGAAWPVKEQLTAAYPDWVDVVEMSRNTGSARGFSTSIQRALDLGAGYVWLLVTVPYPMRSCAELIEESMCHMMREDEAERPKCSHVIR